MNKLVFYFSLFLLIVVCSCKSNTNNKNQSIIQADSTEMEIQDSTIDSVLVKAKVLGDTLYRRAELKNDCLVTKADLDEVNTKFTLRGAYINPKILNELIPWLSDDKDAILAIDIAPYNVGSNKYFCDTPPYKIQNGYIRLEEKSTEQLGTEYYSYKWMGMLNNKIHVIKFVNDGTGFSGVFHSLLFVRFGISKHLAYEENYNQLIMHNVGVFVMGDRTKYEVQLNKKANQVKLTYINDDGISISKIIKPQIDFN